MLTSILQHVLFCVKHTNAKDFELITKSSIQYMKNFIEQLKKRKKSITWCLRYVVLPGMTDRPKDVDALIDLIKDCEFSTSLTRIELLPYHELGVYKWKEMGMEFVFLNLYSLFMTFSLFFLNSVNFHKDIQSATFPGPRKSIWRRFKAK